MKALTIATVVLLSAQFARGESPGRVRLTDFASGTSDYSEAFDAAIKSLCPVEGSLCGGVIEIPAGLFPVARSIDVPAGIHIKGVGDGTIVVSRAKQCSGVAPPSVVFRFKRGGAGLPDGGLEGLTVTSEDERHFVPCGPWPIERTKTSQSFHADGSGSFDGCYVPGEGGEQRFDPTRMNSIGVLVEGGEAGRFDMRAVRACGLGTGFKLQDARGGFAEGITSTINNTGLIVEGGSDWTFENLMFHANVLGTIFRASSSGQAPRNFQVMGGLLQSSRELGALIQSCVNCSWTGIHFENNGTLFEAGGDIRLDGSGATRHFTVHGAAHSAWPATLVENRKAKGCPVDYLSFDDDVGSGWSNNLEVLSDCPLRLHAQPDWMGLRRAPSAAPSRLTLFDTGGRGSLTMNATGQVGLGGEEGEAALTIHRPAGDEAAPLASLRGEKEVIVRFVPDLRGPWTELRAVAGLVPSVELGRDGLLIGSDGRVAVGTALAEGQALAIHGELASQTLSVGSFQPQRSPPTTCDERHRGLLTMTTDTPRICVVVQGNYRWLTVGP